MVRKKSKRTDKKTRTEGRTVASLGCLDSKRVSLVHSMKWPERNQRGEKSVGERERERERDRKEDKKGYQSGRVE